MFHNLDCTTLGGCQNFLRWLSEIPYSFQQVICNQGCENMKLYKKGIFQVEFCLKNGKD